MQKMGDKNARHDFTVKNEESKTPAKVMASKQQLALWKTNE